MISRVYSTKITPFGYEFCAIFFALKKGDLLEHVTIHRIGHFTGDPTSLSEMYSFPLLFNIQYEKLISVTIILWVFNGKNKQGEVATLEKSRS